MAVTQKAARASHSEAQQKFDEATRCLKENNPLRAEALYEAVIMLEPDYFAAHSNLGNVKQMLGKPKDAETYFRNAIALKSDAPIPHKNLGTLLMEQGCLDDAIASFEKAAALAPDDEGISASLAGAYTNAGKNQRAIEQLNRLLLINPGNDEYWVNFAVAFRGLEPVMMDKVMLRNVILCLSHHAVAPQYLMRPLLYYFKHQPATMHALNAVDIVGDLGLEQMMFPPNASPVYYDLLLQTVMERAFIANRAYEKLFRASRRVLLNALAANTLSEENAGHISRFAIALALQCFINEYVFSQPEEEWAKVKDLLAALPGSPSAVSNIDKVKIAVIASYQALHEIDYFTQHAESLSRIDDPIFQRLLRRQLIEPLQEKEIKRDIRSFDRVENAVSQQVKEQYEENPYPRWTSVDLHKKIPFRHYTGSQIKHLPRAELPGANKPDVLVAGCGTGAETLMLAHVVDYKTFTAVDLSTSSLAYAIRKAKSHGIKDINFMQGDILNLGALNRDFDFISCNGVLHHMQDPMKGWKVLVDLLRPDGFMKIALYSEIARSAVVECRDYIKEKGYQDTPDDIRRFREDIFAEKNPALLTKLMHFRDFFSLSECRDLLFHRQEHRFTAPMLKAATESLGLEFLGFTLPRPEIRKAYIRQFPGDPYGISLANWHQFEQENPDTFRAMYQFWVRKKKG